MEVHTFSLTVQTIMYISPDYHAHTFSMYVLPTQPTHTGKCAHIAHTHRQVGCGALLPFSVRYLRQNHQLPAPVRFACAAEDVLKRKQNRHATATKGYICILCLPRMTCLLVISACAASCGPDVIEKNLLPVVCKACLWTSEWCWTRVTRTPGAPGVHGRRAQRPPHGRQEHQRAHS